jgi:hypothetical protein
LAVYRKFTLNEKVEKRSRNVPWMLFYFLFFLEKSTPVTFRK